MKTKLCMLLLFVTAFVQAQIFEPVTWETAVKKISDTEYELSATAKIESGWHLYSQSVPEGGPVATSFSFEGNSNYLKKGNTTEEAGHTINDPIFEMKIKYFADKTTFKQRVKIRNTDAFQIKGTVTFMVCDDSRCLPPSSVDLVFNIN
ncbi:protein-disulfide reductase DsbD domain-containing protein [Zunongwangia pacifica]|uniref:Protein-disulfide reductase DsbD N-terminal domain-containing protein n=1 Tax=Zunongwangia pacifica TaxID=2911062 RepID=A0A9X1ZUP2_9FLAO|nr:protein-disulfide reductase DsbD domain-containing protein [Zunongwangia pacifica]MCL6220446.1 protein-disulfide reductase DsbD N-terminal domain-containing protein [Zunongwangia pacifica]